MTEKNTLPTIDTSLYHQKWIALVRERVIGVGETAETAYRAAKQVRPKDEPDLWFVDEAGRLHRPNASVSISNRALAWLESSKLLKNTLECLQSRQIEAYLVGGAVRDFLLDRAQVVDFDFAVPGDGLRVARQVANWLQGAFYPLDAERGTGRVVIDAPETGKIYLDFAAFRGKTLADDLADRDFTINAIALSLTGLPELIDPLQGQRDLEREQIRATSAQAFSRDPVRVLRAVRQAVAFDFEIEAETESLLHQAAPRLKQVSPERQRDELIKLLNTPAPGLAVEMLHDLGVLAHILPEVEAMVGVTQSPPHHLDVFKHTMLALNIWADWRARRQFGLPEALQEAIRPYLAQNLAGDLDIAALMPLAILLHDTGKPLTRTEEKSGEGSRIRFLGHARESARLARRVLKRLRVSGQASMLVSSVVMHHMRPLHLAAEGRASRRAIYRFFRDTSGPSVQAGVAVALHALVDQAATYPPGQGQDEAVKLRQIVAQLLTAYFEQRDQVVDPPPLLTGRDLIEIFDLSPGRLIGVLLKNLKEAQATGQVQDRAAAIAFIKSDPNFAHHQEKDL